MKQENLHTAKLLSGRISFDNDKCLVLWYKTDSHIELIIDKTSNSSPILHMKVSETNNEWILKNVTLPKGKPAEIILQGIVHGGNGGYIALDDIDIQDWNCDGKRSICYAVHFN